MSLSTDEARQEKKREVDPWPLGPVDEALIEQELVNFPVLRQLWSRREWVGAPTIIGADGKYYYTQIFRTSDPTTPAARPFVEALNHLLGMIEMTITFGSGPREELLPYPVRFTANVHATRNPVLRVLMPIMVYAHGPEQWISTEMGICAGAVR